MVPLLQRGPIQQWSAVASSNDGSRLVATVKEGQIYISGDSGATWTARDSVRNWTSVASSGDGTKLVAVARADQIFTSTNSGATWTVRANDASRYWQAIAMSQDGSKLVAATYMGTAYTSQDYGVTWISGNSIHDGSAVAASSDGTKLLVSGSGGFIYTTATVVKEVAKIPTNKAKGSITIKKLSAISYLLTVTSNSPLTKFTITATKNKNRTLTFKGMTNANGASTVRVAANLLGYSLTLKF